MISLWWHGQHSFCLRASGLTFYLDPFISPLPGRLVPPLCSLDHLAQADYILGSHDHADHIDRPVWRALAAYSDKPRFVVPAALLGRLSAEMEVPDGRFIALDDGGHFQSGDLRISALASAHEFLDQDPATGRYPYLGYVIDVGGFTLYHSGDCCVYEGLLTKLKPFKPDLMLLPINGRSAQKLRQGIIGNMGYQEAADLAGALGPAYVIPAHYDMFAGNQEDPALFKDYVSTKYPGMSCLVPAHGERLDFLKAPGVSMTLVEYHARR